MERRIGESVCRYVRRGREEGRKREKEGRERK
jgi:hypothetical protein